jgi:hypothetical protein
MPSKRVSRRKYTKRMKMNSRRSLKNRKTKSRRVRRIYRKEKGGMRRIATTVTRHARNIGKELGKDQLESKVKDSLDRFHSPRKLSYSTHKISHFESNKNSEHPFIREAKTNITPPLGKSLKSLSNIMESPKRFMETPLKNIAKRDNIYKLANDISNVDNDYLVQSLTSKFDKIAL